MKYLSQIFSSIDWVIMIPVAIFLIVSLATLSSLDPVFFKSQLIFAAISFIAFLFFSQINPNILRPLAIPIYVVSIFLLFLVLIIGLESHGSVRWVEILGFQFQFSEILKPFLAISLASYLSGIENYSFKNFISVLVLLAPIFILIFIQPDLGNALIYLSVVFLTLFIFGFPIKWFASIFSLGLLSTPFLWLILHDYQRQRILVFLNPSHDPLGKSYNAIQSIIAVGSGMFAGKGLGQGTQSVLKFLPEHHTDFIFATISEDLGFIGALVIIISFAILLYRIYKIYDNEEDKFSKIFSITVFSIIVIHFFINVGMNIGLVPVVGVTLPFISYGGSSLLSNFILLALLIAVARSSKRRDILEIG